MKPQEWLLAACLLCAVVAAIALVRAAEWTAAHWGLVALLAAGLVGLALVLWERERAHQWREAYIKAEIGNWGRVRKLQEWPKMCLICACPVWSWRAAAIHSGTCEGCNVPAERVPWTAVVEQPGDELEHAE